MKKLLVFGISLVPFFSLTAFASPVDDAVNQMRVVNTISPVTYKGLPVMGNQLLSSYIEKIRKRDRPKILNYKTIP